MKHRSFKTKGLEAIAFFQQTPEKKAHVKTAGFSLIEILVVIAIVGIMAGLGVASFTGLARKYDVDNQLRRIYADMTHVRIMAMNKNRTHFISLTANGYTAYDDSNPAPDGDGILTTGSDTVVSTGKQGFNLSSIKSQNFLPIAWSGNAQMEFNSRGLCAASNTICVYSNVTPRYDCIKVSSTRIMLGKLTTQGVCSENNCLVR